VKSHVGKSKEEKSTIAANSFSSAQHGNRSNPQFIDNESMGQNLIFLIMKIELG